jgi:hypothetical protein
MAATIGAIAIPFLLSFGNFTMSKMKGVQENTVDLFLNISLTMVMWICMRSQGLTSALFYEEFSFWDCWVLLFFSLAQVVVQSL